MGGFNFEKNLLHQTRAVESTVAVFEDINISNTVDMNKNHINPELKCRGSCQYYDNLKKIVDANEITQRIDSSSNIIDIMMETGTGKTYTYAKTIFELNQHYGLFKFVVIVPTLSIKAGTIDFLNGSSARKHFKDQYGKTLTLHIVQSQKSGKNKKPCMPPAISSFVNAGSFEKTKIQVLIINTGMINSETMQKDFDRSLLDEYTVPSEAIAAVKPFLIVDEPHKFDKANKTWGNIEKMKPQFILRYGATFPEKSSKKKDFTGKMQTIKVKDYHNLIYTLNAVDSFNQNLVKGIIGHTTEFKEGNQALVRFVSSDGKEASFELIDSQAKTRFNIGKGEGLEKIHSAMTNLSIERLNQSTVVLSNGLEMKRGDKLNPYSYDETLQESMIRKTVRNHFKIEKALLAREAKIKPLTLFFIDNIEEYRDKGGYIRTLVEQYIEVEIKALLQTETGFYKQHLEIALADISKTHGGYFSKDNSEKDDKIEKEINEILHDKQSMLDLDNPRRFIFSKWTLREGWDNPNVFQICKLRSSGSDISKLQEVGRGLRLPVNQYGNRVKNEQFYLDYFVDFTESDFIDNLVAEINDKSGAISIEEEPERLRDDVIKKIVAKYQLNEDDFIDSLVDKKIIRASHRFLQGGFDYIKQKYPLIFEGVSPDKVKKGGEQKKTITVRTEKYQALKALWEQLNEKVILEYKFKNEAAFKAIFIAFLQERNSIFSTNNAIEKESRIAIVNNQVVSIGEQSALYDGTPIATMKYSDFLKALSKALNINLKTLHQSFIQSEVTINQYLNATTIRAIRTNFNDFLMYRAMTDFEIDYQSVSSNIHPTRLTNRHGDVVKEVLASDVGTFYVNGETASNYLFNELFYDSELERDNITNTIKEVVVFTKIPKNSIKIPVAGGETYSPDFAYVLNFKNGTNQMHFIVETKGVDGEDSLRKKEKQKIKHAEQFFKHGVKIRFETQFNNNNIVDLIKSIVENT